MLPQAASPQLEVEHCCLLYRVSGTTGARPSPRAVEVTNQLERRYEPGYGRGPRPLRLVCRLLIFLNVNLKVRLGVAVYCPLQPEVAATGAAATSLTSDLASMYGTWSLDGPLACVRWALASTSIADLDRLIRRFGGGQR